MSTVNRMREEKRKSGTKRFEERTGEAEGMGLVAMGNAGGEDLRMYSTGRNTAAPISCNDGEFRKFPSQI